VENYRQKYSEVNGNLPSERLVRQYSKMRSIEYPLLSEEEYCKKVMDI
jgi:hypothetical protein